MQNPIPDCLTQVGNTSIAFTSNWNNSHTVRTLYLNVGDHEGGRDVHLDPHAEEGDDGRGPGLGALVWDEPHQDAEHESVDGEEPSVGPPPPDLVGQDRPQEVAGALHQAQEEEVEEGVAGHVLDIDDHLVVDEGGGGEPDGAEDGPDGQCRPGEQAEVAEGFLLCGVRELLQSAVEVSGRSHAVGLRDPPHDRGRLLRLTLGDQPARGLGQQLPREEEQGEGRHRHDLQDLPGGDEPADQGEEDLAEGPGKADHADDEASLLDVGNLTENIHWRLEQRQHSEGGRDLNSNELLQYFSGEYLEEGEEVIVVTGGDHAEREDDAGGGADVETQLPSEEVRHGAEDEGPEDEPHHGQGVQVGHHHRFIADPVILGDRRVFELRGVVLPLRALGQLRLRLLNVMNVYCLLEIRIPDLLCPPAGPAPQSRYRRYLSSWS